MRERLRIDGALDGARHEQRFQLGTVEEASFVLGVVQGLDPGAVARKPQRAGPAVPQRDPEHPPEPLEDTAAPLLVPVDDHLGVGGGGEAVPRVRELAPKLAKVVDLAVEDDLHGAVFRANRLVARREVDDAQAPHAQADARLHAHPLVVGPSVANDVAHPAHEPRVGVETLRGVRVIARQRVGEAGDSTHDILCCKTGWTTGGASPPGRGRDCASSEIVRSPRGRDVATTGAPS